MAERSPGRAGWHLYSKTITAQVQIPEGCGNGAILVQGGRFDGWAPYVNDEKVAKGRIDRTQPMVFSADKTADVGVDLGQPVVEAIGAGTRSRFTGRIPA